MADLGYQFDATAVDPNTGFDPLPTDWYNCMITESEVKRTKDGQGAYLQLTYKVIDGKFKDRQFWDRLNIWNKNPVAVEIAQGSLSAICHSIGVYQVQDTQVLHGKPLMARVVEKPPEGGYDASNDVKGYAKVGDKVSQNAAGGSGGAQPAAPPPPSVPQAPQAPAAPPAAQPSSPAAPPAPEPSAPQPPTPPAVTPPQPPEQQQAPQQQAPSNPPTTPPWAQ